MAKASGMKRLPLSTPRCNEVATLDHAHSRRDMRAACQRGKEPPK
jgi:hypothetical protein